ncbi:MAG TPA: hypothetical protein PK762_02535, partial [Candidatus Kapabacteria bacterium]|nr:hypothetical protein [Candidatus Kapabacteria bacterium]
MFNLRGDDITKFVRIYLFIVQLLFYISYLKEAFGLAQMYREKLTCFPKMDSGIHQKYSFLTINLIT